MFCWNLSNLPLADSYCGDTTRDVEREPAQHQTTVSILRPFCWSCQCNKDLVARLHHFFLLHVLISPSLDPALAAQCCLRSEAGYKCATIDVEYCPGERTMDFLSPAGFLWAGCKLINDICCIFIWEIIDRGNDEMYVSSYIRTNPLHDLQKLQFKSVSDFKGMKTTQSELYLGWWSGQSFVKSKSPWTWWAHVVQAGVSLQGVPHAVPSWIATD